MISVAPALGNAIHQATGAELMHMPMRFEDVWRALLDKAPIDNWITDSPYGSCRSDLPSGPHPLEVAAGPELQPREAPVATAPV
jgi:hypothetical protein